MPIISFFKKTIHIILVYKVSKVEYSDNVSIFFKFARISLNKIYIALYKRCYSSFQQKALNFNSQNMHYHTAQTKKLNQGLHCSPDPTKTD